MANIHAINAQGTEYGLEAENGITQEQVDAIATIGDVADLETTEKTTLVGAVNEVNEKFARETVLYENTTPTDAQGSQSINVSGLANAKSLKITFGTYESASGGLEEKVCPLVPNIFNSFYLSQVKYEADAPTQRIESRKVSINSARSVLTVSNGTLYTYDVVPNVEQIRASADVAKVIKVIAIF